MDQLKTVTAVREALAERHVHNSFNLAFSKGAILIDFMARDTGRGGRNAKWQANRVGYRNDPTGPYYNNGIKTFNVYGRDDRASKLAEAIEWASERYSVEDFVKDPFGNYQPRAQLVALLAHFDIVWTTLNTRRKSS
jgi:hypothetical protein